MIDKMLSLRLKPNPSRARLEIRLVRLKESVALGRLRVNGEKSVVRELRGRVCREQEIAREVRL